MTDQIRLHMNTGNPALTKGLLDTLNDGKPKRRRRKRKPEKEPEGKHKNLIEGSRERITITRERMREMAGFLPHDHCHQGQLYTLDHRRVWFPVIDIALLVYGWNFSADYVIEEHEFGSVEICQLYWKGEPVGELRKDGIDTEGYQRYVLNINSGEEVHHFVSSHYLAFRFRDWKCNKFNKAE